MACEGALGLQSQDSGQLVVLVPTAAALLLPLRVVPLVAVVCCQCRLDVVLHCLSVCSRLKAFTMWHVFM